MKGNHNVGLWPLNEIEGDSLVTVVNFGLLLSLCFSLSLAECTEVLTGYFLKMLKEKIQGTLYMSS